jgi:predicted glycosyltransferase
MLVTGAASAERLVRGPGLTCVPLPAVVKVANGRYLPAQGHRKLHDVMSDRAQVIAAAVRDFQPDVLLVDRYPRGLHEELVPALRVHAARRPGAPAVLGLRDILDSPGVIRAEWQAEDYSEAILETYATVLCYGDRAVYDPIREYSLPRAVADRVRFTGYLADAVQAGDAAVVRRRHRSPDRRLAVCTLGGGRDAAHIAQSFIGAIDRLADAGWNGLLITGPYMTNEDFRGLLAIAGDARVTVIRMVDDLPSYLAAADAAVCMGGYNTTCELLALGVPAVIVPRVRPRQEQQMRAELLAARGLAWCLHPDELSADALAERIPCAAAGSRAEISERLDSIARRGVQTAAGEIAALLPAPRARHAPTRVLAGPKPRMKGIGSARPHPPASSLGRNLP